MELIREVGIAVQTRYRWRKHYEELETEQAARWSNCMKAQGVKRLVAELALDNMMLRNVGANNLSSRGAVPAVGYLERQQELVSTASDLFMKARMQ